MYFGHAQVWQFVGPTPATYLCTCIEFSVCTANPLHHLRIYELSAYGKARKCCPSVAVPPKGPHLLYYPTNVASCILGLDESNVAKVPCFAAFSTVVLIQKWQQHNERPPLFDSFGNNWTGGYTMLKAKSKRPCSVASGLLWIHIPGHVARALLPCRAAWGVVARA
jgi:hypothetical protein